MAVENALAFLRGGARAAMPVYLIAGPHPFLREYALESLRLRMVRDGYQYRAFQVGAGDGYGAVISEIEGADLFAPRRLVACRVMKTHRARATADSDGDEDDGAPSGGRTAGGDEAALISAIGRIGGAVILALLYERDNAPPKIRRAAEQAGTVVNCMRPFDNQLAQYAAVLARDRKLELTPGAAEMLVGRHGGDLGAIANALAKAAIFRGDGARIDREDLSEPAARRIPDLFELAESVARGNAAETIALFDRAADTGRDSIEMLAVEIIPLLRRMLVAAAVLKRRKGAAEVAGALGLAPSSQMVARAVEGARRFGLARLERAHRRATELDARFKNGLIREREPAIAGLLLDLMDPARG